MNMIDDAMNKKREMKERLDPQSEVADLENSTMSQRKIKKESKHYEEKTMNKYHHKFLKKDNF